MIPEIGVFCLILAGCLGILQVMMATGALGQSHLSSRLCATTVFLFASMALGCLVWSHATSDFSVLNVIEHSHTAKPMIYKITGAWGNHEGSMLLWFWVLTL